LGKRQKSLSRKLWKGPKGIDRKQTTPVGCFKVANAFGLYDMHGNVWEWCEDDYHPNYQGAPTDGSAWISKNKPTTKVLRGGSWYYNPRYLPFRLPLHDNNRAGDDNHTVFGWCAVLGGL
jgi:formylglycine-generating enzyme required for sulfatase activity